MVRREHNNRISSVRVDTDKKQRHNNTTIKGEGDAQMMGRDGSTVIL